MVEVIKKVPYFRWPRRVQKNSQQRSNGVMASAVYQSTHTQCPRRLILKNMFLKQPKHQNKQPKHRSKQPKHMTRFCGQNSRVFPRFSKFNISPLCQIRSITERRYVRSHLHLLPMVQFECNRYVNW